jgi:ribosome-associated translation inhibitor RaiA
MAIATPVRIVFRDMEPSEAVRQVVEKKLAKLGEKARIVGGEVAIEAPHRQHHQGTHFRVRVDLQVPGEEIVYGRDPGDDGGHEDVYVAIRDAFAAVTRRITEHAKKRRGFVKSHEDPQGMKMDQDVRFPARFNRT